ncbi:MAG: hypothetical protein IJ599_02840 [Alphaproteobacteria bacterium]|nr:hypothetical protein [Alphaproteobacteria bacterium]
MKNNNNNAQNTALRCPKLGCILDLLITLTLALLLLASYARGGEEELIKHLNSPGLPYTQYMQDGWNKADIKSKLPEFVDYSHKPDTILPALEKIADNPVGKLTLCLLYQARHNMPKERLRIFVDDREPEYIKDECGKNINVGGKQTQFCHNDFCIYLNSPEITETAAVVYLNGKLFPHKYSKNSYLFHELLHAFHYAIGYSQTGKNAALNYIYDANKIQFNANKLEHLKKLWVNDEELCTIAGTRLIDNRLYCDPLNSNLYEAFKKKYPGIIMYQRVYHRTKLLEKELRKDSSNPEYLIGLDKILINFVDFGF